MARYAVLMVACACVAVGAAFAIRMQAARTPIDRGPVYWGPCIAEARGIYDVHVSPDATVVAAETDRDLRIFRVKDGSLVCKLDGRRSIAFSPDRKSFASSTGDTAGLFELETGKERAKLEGLRRVFAFNHDGKLLAALGAKSEVVVRSIENSADVLAIPIEKGHAQSAAFSADGKLVAIHVESRETKVERLSNDIESASVGKPEHSIAIWSIDDKTERKRWIAGDLNHDAGKLFFSPDSRHLACRSALWNVESGKLIALDESGENGADQIACFTNDGKAVVHWMHGAIHLTNPATKALLSKANLDSDQERSRVRLMTGVPFGASFGLIDYKFTLWNATTGKLVQKFDAT